MYTVYNVVCICFLKCKTHREHVTSRSGDSARDLRYLNYVQNGNTHKFPYINKYNSAYSTVVFQAEVNQLVSLDFIAIQLFPPTSSVHSSLFLF